MARKTTNINIVDMTDRAAMSCRPGLNHPGLDRPGREPNQSAHVNFPFSYVLSSFINSEVPQRRNTNGRNHSYR